MTEDQRLDEMDMLITLLIELKAGNSLGETLIDSAVHRLIELITNKF